MAAPRSALKGQDILLLLKLLALKKSGNQTDVRQTDLAQSLDLSQAEIVHSLRRLRRSQLLSREKLSPWVLAATEFLVHGLRYVFPADRGPVTRGTPTGLLAWQSERSKNKGSDRVVVGEENRHVWPDPEGDSRGPALEPIYKTAPSSARQDGELHRLLALVDSIRVGTVRERTIAIEHLQRELKARDPGHAKESQ